MKRVPVTDEQHRKAKAMAAEMGLTLERFMDCAIEYAVARPVDVIGHRLTVTAANGQREEQRS